MKLSVIARQLHCGLLGSFIRSLSLLFLLDPLSATLKSSKYVE